MSAPAQPAIIGFEEEPARTGATVIPMPVSEQPARKQPKRRRGHVVQFRADDEELAALEARARDAGLTIGAYLRSASLGDAGPRARRRLSIDREALAHAVAEFNRAGSNLNQITRALNEIAAAERAGEGRDRLADRLDQLGAPIRSLQEQFAVPLAAILSVLGHDRAP